MNDHNLVLYYVVRRTPESKGYAKVEAIDVRPSEKGGNLRRSTTSRVLRNGRRRRKIK